ncbi:hypothetical protein GCM10009533_38120 [Saccharopolyspora spinosporotrichia]|uniref:Uncharacterized protein n=1 Tax=Saccharopolyspora erythraea TaxID=1836 RepID=A0ABN1D667_SACER
MCHTKDIRSRGGSVGQRRRPPGPVPGRSVRAEKKRPRIRPANRKDAGAVAWTRPWRALAGQREGYPAVAPESRESTLVRVREPETPTRDTDSGAAVTYRRAEP